MLLLADKVSASILKNAAIRHIGKNFKVIEGSAEIDKLSDAGNSNLVRGIFAAVARWGIK